jgi:hypothetical protein
MEGKKIRKTSTLLPKSSHEKRKHEEKNLGCLEIKEETISESIENLFKIQVVSKNPEVDSANQFFLSSGKARSNAGRTSRWIFYRIHQGGDSRLSTTSNCET